MKLRQGYSGAQISLHWIIAVLILFNYIYSDGMGRALDARLENTPLPQLGINPVIHVWIGVAVLLLCALRLGLRLGGGAPAPGGSGLMQSAAAWGHRLLYALMFLVPLAGAITWFGGVEATGDLHAVLANALLVVAGGHALVAIYHQFVIRDGLLARMTRPGSM